MKRVQLPDGSIAEFPADMPDAQIEQVLRQQFPPQQAPGLTLDDMTARRKAAGFNDASDFLTQPDPSRMAGIGQIGLSLLGSTVSEPASGIAGTAQGLNPLTDRPAADAVRAVRERLDVPLGPQGERLIAEGFQGIPEPVRRSVINAAGRFNEFADAAARAFGPAAGAAVKTAPVGAAEVLGVKGARRLLMQAGRATRASKSRVVKEIRDAAPSVQQLKDASQIIYDDLDNAGVRIKNEQYNRLAIAARATLIKEGGINPRLSNQAHEAVDDIVRAAQSGEPVQFELMLSHRKALDNVARSATDPANSHPAGKVRDLMDQFIEGLTTAKFDGRAIKGAGEKARMARGLWRRAKRAETLDDAVERARDLSSASGFENGIRREFRSILGNDKKKDLFTADELDLLRDVASGKPVGNLFRLFGKLGYEGGGGAANAIVMSIGSGAGFAAGGPAGAVIVPAIGTVSRKLGERLTVRNAEMANQVIRAGSDADKIVAAYIRNIPQSKRDPTELAQLLMRPDIPLQGVAGGQPLISRAVLIAAMQRQRQAELAAGAAAGAVTSGALQE